MRERKEILIDLVKNNGDVFGLVQELAQYPWDAESSLYTINAEDISKMLARYSQSIIAAKTLEDWANAIEGRDDLGFEGEEIQEIISQIANPVLFGHISKEKAETYKRQLRLLR
ncbi:MAG: hypothetical protein WBD22_07445 [Pyrinomonadaceae bacterium]